MKKTLIFLNILMLIAVLFTSYGFYYYHKVYIKTFDQCSYKLSMFDFHYKSEPANYKVVMLGDSFMRIESWDSLLNRTDIVSRGISGDRIHCICERADYLKGSPARIVFIEGGINDLPGETPDSIFGYYKKMAEFLVKQNKLVAINAVLYIAPKSGKMHPAKKDYMAVNKTIQSVNKKLKAYTAEKGFDYIDLNKDISDESKLVLKDQYTQDGIHPNSTAFRIWGKHVEDVLNKHSI